MSKYPGRVITDLAPAGYSVFFDGSGDYGRIASSQTALQFGTGNFTVELWVYPTAASGATNYQLITGGTSWSTGSGGLFFNPSNSSIRAAWNQIGANPAVTTGTLALNVWYHVALVRNSNTLALYLNGVSVSTLALSGSDSLAVNNQSQTNIGGGGWDADFPGYISNLRVIKGTALYTTNFTPPTQLFPITNTSLLTCQSPTFIDNSANAFSISSFGTAAPSTFTPFTAYVPYNPALGAATPGVWTVDEAMQAAATRQWNMYDPYFNLTTLLLHGNPTNGTTWLTDASANNFTVTPVADARAANLSPFSLTTFATSGSGYFDGTGDYLSIAHNAAFNLGSNDWCIEFFIFKLNNATSTLVTKRPNNVTAAFPNIFANTSNQIGVELGGTTFTTASAITLNVWNHVAIVKNGSGSANVRCYINGVADANTGTLSTAITSNTNALVLCGDTNGNQLTGYMSNFRLVNGNAVYTGNFTTPTAPLTATQAAGTNIAAITGTQTSLLTLQNSQSANNNAFLDSSSNNFLITRNGNTTQGSFSPFSQTGWSNFFTAASSQFISLPNNAAFQFGAPSGNTNDFVVEFFVYPTTTAISAPVHTGYTSGTTYWGFNLNRTTGGVNTAGHVQFFLTDNFNVTATTGLISNQQNHICAVRTGTTVSLFVNGVRQATGTSSVNPNPTGLLYVGGEALSLGRYLDGYVSNLRIIKGATLPYDANALSITVPTSQLTAITGTTVLTCQSNRFVDNSINNFTISTSGTPSVQAFSPFYPTAAYTPQTIGGSGYFDGTGDYLSSATSTDLQLGSSDFSLEWWEYRTAANNVDTAIVCGDGTFSALLGYYNSGAVRFYLSTTGSSWNVFSDTSAGTTVSNSWNHFVLTRSGTAFRVFLNGVLGAYATGSGSVTQTTNQIFISGGINGSSAPMEGYMSGVRFVKGSIPTSYQTSSTTTNTSVFTPPTAPVTTTSQGATSGDVKYLVNFTNAGIVDSTGKNALETVGNAQISTAVSRFGGSSIAFDGTGDYLTSNSGTDLYAFGSGDFTIEMWVNFAVVGSSGVYTLYDSRPNGTQGAYASIALDRSTAKIYYYVSSATRITGSVTIVANTWYHVAICRSGTSTRLFVNGTQDGSTWTDTTTYLNPANRPVIAASGSSIGTEATNGYIDELRVTKGFARYTGNFTPQTSQWQDQ